MRKHLKKRFQTLSLTSRLCLILSAVFILSLIPLLHIGLYAHAAGYDFAFGLQAHLAWKETRSLPAVIHAALNTVKSYYYSWQGTYSSIFLMALQPAVISERLYPLTCVIMLAMLIGSHLFLFRTLFTFYLKLDKGMWVSLALSVLLLSIQILDSPGAAFFWYNGAVHYVFMHSCMIFLMAVLLLFLKTSKKSTQGICLLSACFLSFTAGGANYVTALLTPLLIALLTALSLLYKNKRGLLCFFPLFLALAGLGINASAPGNAVRMAEQIDSMEPLEAVYHSFLYALKGIGSWTTLYVVFFLLLLFPFLFGALYQKDFHFPLPGIPALFSFCLIAASYTPSLYSMGHVIIYERTLNIMRMFYYLLLFLNLVYFTGWITEKCRSYDTTFKLPGVLQEFRQKCSRSFCLSMGIFFLCLLLFSDKNQVTSLSAVDSLWKGYAQSYHAESLNRTILLSVDGVDEVWVPNFSVCPPLLNPQSLSTDPSEYPNPTIAAWYGKTTLHLSVIY